MLDSPAVSAVDDSAATSLGDGTVRVGFVTQLLWERYGGFWVELVKGAGATPVFATPEEAMGADERAAAEGFPGSSFRLAAAQAQALAGCDLVIVPRLNPESASQRGGAQDRWIADLPGALREAVPALGETLAVATFPDPDLESVAVGLLRRLLGDVAMVPRVWSRHRSSAERLAQGPAKAPRQRLERAAAGKLAAGGATGLIGQPWVLTQRLMARLSAGEQSYVSQLQLDPLRCREEGWRSDERLIDTDAEVLGAARILSRRAGVASLRFIADGPAPQISSTSDAWLAKRAAAGSHKPQTTWHLADAIAAHKPAPYEPASHGPWSRDLLDTLFHLPDDLPVD